MLYLTLKRHFLTLPVGFDDDSLFAFKRLDCGRCGRTADTHGRYTLVGEMNVNLSNSSTSTNWEEAKKHWRLNIRGNGVQCFSSPCSDEEYLRFASVI
jgi:hypothetical protein